MAVAASKTWMPGKPTLNKGRLWSPKAASCWEQGQNKSPGTNWFLKQKRGWEFFLSVCEHFELTLGVRFLSQDRGPGRFWTPEGVHGEQRGWMKFLLLGRAERSADSSGIEHPSLPCVCALNRVEDGGERREAATQEKIK